MLNYVKVSNNELHAFGSELCRLFQLGLQALTVFTEMLLRAGLPCMGMPALRTQCCACPSPTLLKHRCALLSASWITVSTSFKMAPIKCFYFGVNERQLTTLNFPKEVRTRQKLVAFLFLVDLFHVELFTSSTGT